MNWHARQSSSACEKSVAPYSTWYVDLAMRKEHGEFLLGKYVYDEQEGGEK